MSLKITSLHQFLDFTENGKQRVRALLLRLRGKHPRSAIANGIFCLVNFCKFSSHRFSSLDACHLSGTYGGTLHSTLLIDPSGNLFPLGFSIESGNECVASWTYHLRSLKCILPPPFFFRLTIVSDRKKGLESVIQEELPDSLKRHCLQHLAESVKASCGGRQAAAQLRLLAKLQEPAEFLDAFQQPAESLVDYLQEVGEYSLWNMAHALGPLYGHLSSNASESLNALLLPSRCLNVIGIVEGIRCKVAAFTSVRRLMYSGLDASQPTDGDVKTHLQNSISAGQRFALLPQGDCWEVKSGNDRGVVSEQDGGWECTCRALS